jgi:hypothetical protein
MGNLPRLPGIMQASCQPGRKVQPAFDILEQQEAAIGGQAPERVNDYETGAGSI